MGKYVNIESDIFSIFGDFAWVVENIKTYPSNFIPKGDEYIQVSIIPGSNGVNRDSISGILIIDIYTPAGEGPNRSSTIADKLDDYLEGKIITVAGSLQMGTSTLSSVTTDRDNPALSRRSYTIPFNYFGV